MEQNERSQYRPVSFSKQFHINDVDQNVVIGLHLSSTSVQICAQDRCLTSAMNDSFRKSLTVRTVQVHELLRQDDITPAKSVEDAVKAVVLEVFQGLIFAPYVEPFLSEEQKKIQSEQEASRQRAAEVAARRKEKNLKEKVAARRKEKNLKAEAEREAQEHEKSRISKLWASYPEELRREKEIEKYICEQIEDQASRVRASLDGSVAQNVSIYITDVTSMLELEIHILSKTFDEMLSNCRYHLKNCQSIQAIQDQHCLSHDWINQLRHECTNYDSIIVSLKQQNRHTENIHKLVRFAVNHLINTVWEQRMMILLKGDLDEAKARILKPQEVKEAERQEKARRQEKALAERPRKIEAEQARIETERVQAEAQTRRRLEEQRLRDEQVEQQQRKLQQQRERQAEQERKREAQQQVEPLREAEKMQNTLYVPTKAEVQQYLPKQSYSPRYAWDGQARSVGVLKVIALRDVSSKISVYAVVSEHCYWLDFDDAGCMVHERFATETLTVAKNGFGLALSLMQNFQVGDVVTVAEKEMIVVNIGGGRFSNQENWESLRMTYNKKLAEKKKEEQRAEQQRAEEERVKKKAQEELHQQQRLQENLKHEREKRLAPTSSGGGCIVLLLALGVSTILMSKFSILVFQWIGLLLHKAY